MSEDRRLEVLDMIAADAEADARKLDGQPFDGRTTATNFGQIYASIQALAKIIKSDMESRAS